MTLATRRLFFAFWPDEALRAQIADAAGAVISPCRGKPTIPDNYHITLAFLGDIPAEYFDCVVALGDGLKGSAFSLTLDTFGYFPKARVVWLGASALPPELTNLYDRLADVLPYCHLTSESRPFHPHLTLARKAVRAPDPAIKPNISWQVNDFLLVESELSSDGSSYRPLRRWPLSNNASSTDP